ncbi:replication initiator protein A [Bosea sp. RAC05]|uniref:replication initiator protein A n=1 Tax=Bosea sp. RAC05 TaxID=1842539 RepID=UPI00083D9741|nr:replication initiator protein A [Bosea sp. RAC05]AOG03425.1 replication initiator A family protein [Bosea sp. RAC05]
MADRKIPLKPRQEFAALSLHEKNSYLQDIAHKLRSIAGETVDALDKDALSRLRRYYSRRSLADLKLEEIKSDGLRASLSRMADAIRAEEIRRIVLHDTAKSPAAPVPMYRERPIDDAQLDLLVPMIHDAPIKDDMNLMDVAPFSLSKSGGPSLIRYELKDAIITVEGGADVGMATAYDYDIVINMVSHLAEAMRQYLIDEKKGLRPSLPPRVYRPAAADILKFCRRNLGGKQYLDLERSLDRLQATRVKITNLSPGPDRTGRRETESFPLIGRYKVVSRTSMDRIDLVEIDIPDWVYSGVIRPDGKPTILTMHPDYFLITRPIAKFLYRIARKAAGESEARYSLTELRKRSGSRLAKHKFRAAIEEIVKASEGPESFPDYELSLHQGKQDAILLMRIKPGTKRLAAAEREPQAD